MKLIESDDLLPRLWDYISDVDYEKVKKVISQMPPTEPEIIHCRDCKYYDGRPCGIVNWYNTASDFCSKAVRGNG